MSKFYALIFLALTSMSLSAFAITVESGINHVVDVSYADSIKNLGKFADSYQLKLVSYNVSDKGWSKIKIVAQAGELDEQVWELPQTFSSMSSVSLKGTKLILVGYQVRESNFTRFPVTLEINFNKQQKHPGTPSLLESAIHIKNR